MWREWNAVRLGWALGEYGESSLAFCCGKNDPESKDTNGRREWLNAPLYAAAVSMVSRYEYPLLLSIEFQESVVVL